MTKSDGHMKTSRRDFLKKTAAAAAGGSVALAGVASANAAGNPDNLPPKIAPLVKGAWH